MNSKRWFSAVAVLSVLVMLIAASVEPIPNILTTAGKPVTTPTVIIDAGHGGFDGGAVAPDGTEEKVANRNKKPH